MGPAEPWLRRWRQGLLAMVLAALLSLLPTGPPGSGASALAAPPAAAGELQVFVREGCPHCAAAKAFLPRLQQQRPDLRVRLRDVGSDPLAREELLRVSQRAGVQAAGVPTFLYQGRVLVGFDDAAGRGRELLALLEAPQKDGAGGGGASAEQLNLGPLGSLSAAGGGVAAEAGVVDVKPGRSQRAGGSPQQRPLAGGHAGRQAQPHPDRHHAEVDDHLHERMRFGAPIFGWPGVQVKR